MSYQLTISARANSKRPGIVILSKSEWLVRVKEPAQDGKANKAIQKAIADRLKLAKSRVQLIKGQTAKFKLFEINEK